MEHDDSGSVYSSCTMLFRRLLLDSRSLVEFLWAVPGLFRTFDFISELELETSVVEDTSDSRRVGLLTGVRLGFLKLLE